MKNPPTIWLDYRPLRIGWVLEGRNLEQLATAASWNSCLWGGCFNPIIPSVDIELSNYLIPTFGIDVLLAVTASETTKAFVAQYPHLQMHLWRHPLFNDRRCEFADIRHAVSRTAVQRARNLLPSVVQPLWSQDDPLAVLLSVMFGRYPEPNDVGINYLKGIRTFLEMEDKPIVRDGELPAMLATSITPISLTSFSLSWRRAFHGDFWLSPGIIFGKVTDFDDLVLFWNLRAAGAKVWFYDPAEQSNRLRSSLEAFLAALREAPEEGTNHLNLWCRSIEELPQWMSELDLSGFALGQCAANAHDWNGHNIRPGRPKFSFWHRDVVPSYAENDEGAVVSFALPDQPFDPDDPSGLGQRFVVTVEASPFGRGTDDWTFNTPYLPRLNNFYSEKLGFGVAGMRSELGHHGRGAIGIIATVGDQRMELRAISVHEWMENFFGLFSVNIKRSEPGLRCARLIQQLDGIQGCSVLKVRGARKLIKEYGPDQNFTREAAERRIGNVNPATNLPEFSEFEDLYIERRKGGKLKPFHVFRYLVSHNVFRVGLEFGCPNCKLESWIQLDEVKTFSTCIYCGHRFDVTPQLKDRDWRYRRSGLFGRDDHQLGGVPVALALQQLDTCLGDGLRMYSTALEFEPQNAAIEKCEADFVVVAVDPGETHQPSIQILIGEAKTSYPIDADDVRKLGKLADAVPPGMAEVFIMFVKTDTLTADEVTLAKSLNSRPRHRVILWSQDELEPYLPYERSKDRLGQGYASRLSDMVQNTDRLWP